MQIELVSYISYPTFFQKGGYATKDEDISSAYYERFCVAILPISKKENRTKNCQNFKLLLPW